MSTLHSPEGDAPYPTADVKPERTEAFAFDAESEALGEIGIFKAQWREQAILVYEEARAQALSDAEKEIRGRLARYEAESMANMEAQTARILGEARREADEMLATARGQADLEREKVRAEGEARGFAQGMDRARSIVASIEAIHSRAEATRSSAIRDAGAELIELSLLVARKIVGGACADSRAVVAETVPRLLSLLGNARPLLLSVSPADLEAVRAALGHETSAAPGVGIASSGVRIEADPAIQPGGCVLETSSGWIDARIESMLAAMETVLRGPAPGPIVADLGAAASRG